MHACLRPSISMLQPIASVYERGQSIFLVHTETPCAAQESIQNRPKLCGVGWLWLQLKRKLRKAPWNIGSKENEEDAVKKTHSDLLVFYYSQKNRHRNSHRTTQPHHIQWLFYISLLCNSNTGFPSLHIYNICPHIQSSSRTSSILSFCPVSWHTLFMAFAAAILPSPPINQI